MNILFQIYLIGVMVNAVVLIVFSNIELRRINKKADWEYFLTEGIIHYIKLCIMSWVVWLYLYRKQEG